MDRMINSEEKKIVLSGRDVSKDFRIKRTLVHAKLKRSWVTRQREISLVPAH